MCTHTCAESPKAAGILSLMEQVRVGKCTPTNGPAPWPQHSLHIYLVKQEVLMNDAVSESLLQTTLAYRMGPLNEEKILKTVYNF